MKKLVLLVLSLVLLVIASYAGAATTAPVTREIALGPTFWSSTIALPKFDQSLGTLNSVFFELTGHVEGTAQLENLDAAPATITTSLSAIVTMKRPDGVVIVTVLPLASTSESVAEFDGDAHFSGPSGRTYSDLADDVTQVFTTSDAGYLAMFSGNDDIVLTMSAQGASSGSGAGNLLQQFTTNASAQATVIYDYTPVPEPAAFPALLLGVVGTALKLRKRV